MLFACSFPLLVALNGLNGGKGNSKGALGRHLKLKGLTVKGTRLSGHLATKPGFR